MSTVQVELPEELFALANVSGTPSRSASKLITLSKSCPRISQLLMSELPVVLRQALVSMSWAALAFWNLLREKISSQICVIRVNSCLRMVSTSTVQF